MEEVLLRYPNAKVISTAGMDYGSEKEDNEFQNSISFMRKS